MTHQIIRLMLFMIGPAFAGLSSLHAQTANPYSNDARMTYALIKASLLRAAEKMPAEDYVFRTVSEVRTFGEMIAHLADAQVRMCGVVKGEVQFPAYPANVADARKLTAKADLIPALKAAFAYCDPVYESMTDAAGIAKINWARWELSKLGLLNWNISHDNEMYGIIGAFLRIKGIVPPSSEATP
jgi:hypothetical protein